MKKADWPSPLAIAATTASDELESFAVEPDPLAELADLGRDLGLGFADDDILPPDQAFQVSASGGDGSSGGGSTISRSITGGNSFGATASILF